jgi:hypothetical protein
MPDRPSTSGGAPAEQRSKPVVGLRLQPETHAMLKAAAEAQRLPMNELADRYIRAGLAGGAASLLEQTALPAIKEAMREAALAQAQLVIGRVTRLQVRVYKEAAVGRRLLSALLADQHGEDRVRELTNAARTMAIKDLQVADQQHEEEA